MTSIRRISCGAALVAVLLVAGCGGSSSSSSSSVSASSYVKSICTAVGSFRTDVQQKISSLNPASFSTPVQGKKAFQDFLSSLATSADAAASKVQGAGTPDVGNGKQISSAVSNAFGKLSSTLKSAETSANSLPTSNSNAFKAGILSLETNVRNSLSGLTSGLSGLKSSALEQAAKKEPSCSSISG
jgi:hypothetical protein